jgi:hypothetical protein
MMSVRARRVGWLIGVALGICVLVLCARMVFQVRLRLRNNTTEVLRRVQVTTADGTAECGEVSPGGECNLSVRPERPSNVVVTFDGPAGAKCRREINAYIANGVAGRIDLTIRACDDVKSDSNLW